MKRALDLFDLQDEIARTTAPGVRAELAHHLRSGLTSATGIPSVFLNFMWWRKSVVRDGESYDEFKKRADAQRAPA